jgi:hypothetical protein
MFFWGASLKNKYEAAVAIALVYQISILCVAQIITAQSIKSKSGVATLQMPDINSSTLKVSSLMFLLFQ